MISDTEIFRDDSNIAKDLETSYMKCRKRITTMKLKRTTKK
jgi:hypothetical protein